MPRKKTKTDDLSKENQVVNEDIKTKEKVCVNGTQRPEMASMQDEDKEPAKRNDTGRDSRGRFTKGNCANPSGRPKVPEILKEYSKQAPERLREIADDPETPAKVKADIEKWFYEVVYGKPTQQQIIDASVENTGTMTVAFEGELADWSE